MNNNISPASYFRNHLFEKNLPKPAKRRKVSTEDFNTPCYSEWEYLITKNYNVSQLKIMARYYKQKISGNKRELVCRMYNYLKYSYYAIILQKKWRGYLRRYYNELKGGFNISSTNTTDFLSLDDIKKIPYSQFFSFEENGHIYGFSAKSLHNLIINNDIPTNPYTRKNLSTNTLNSFYKFLKYGKILKEKVPTTINNNLEGMSLEKRISLYAQNIFHKIDTFGHITNARWFLDLDRQQLIKLVRELVDIWEYRAQLHINIKKGICPPHGNPFSGININHLITQNIITIRMSILNIFENLISKSPNSENQSLGAYYVLSAITLVSSSAADALPWLYESVVYNTN